MKRMTKTADKMKIVKPKLLKIEIVYHNDTVDRYYFSGHLHASVAEYIKWVKPHKNTWLYKENRKQTNYEQIGCYQHRMILMWWR